MKSSEITIKDLARELNISPSTVSRALKDHPDISNKTKKAVVALADELQYTPNIIAQSLRKSKTNTIGVLIPRIIHYFFSTVISGIEDVAYNAGYNIILCQSDESYEKEVSDTKALFRSRVDGFLVSCSRETRQFDHLIDIYNRGIPMVFFDRVFEGLDTNRVIVDDYEGSRKAVQHLVDVGCKRIAHLAGPQGLEISKCRLQGYKDVLEENGIQFDSELVKSDPERREFEGGYKIIQAMLELPGPPDAIFAHQDVAAIGAMKAIKEKSLKIPHDVAVVGFSNWQMSLYTDPPLSSVSQPGFEMGQEAARLFLKQMNHKDPDGNYPYISETKILKTKLIIRESSKRG